MSTAPITHDKSSERPSGPLADTAHPAHKPQVGTADSTVKGAPSHARPAGIVAPGEGKEPARMEVDEEGEPGEVSSSFGMSKLSVVPEKRAAAPVTPPRKAAAAAEDEDPVMPVGSDMLQTMREGRTPEKLRTALLETPGSAVFLLQEGDVRAYVEDLGTVTEFSVDEYAINYRSPYTNQKEQLPANLVCANGARSRLRNGYTELRKIDDDLQALVIKRADVIDAQVRLESECDAYDLYRTLVQTEKHASAAFAVSLPIPVKKAKMKLIRPPSPPPSPPPVRVLPPKKVRAKPAKRSPEDKHEIALLKRVGVLQDLWGDSKLANELKIPTAKRVIMVPPRGKQVFNKALEKTLKKEIGKWVLHVNKNPRNAMTYDKAYDIIEKSMKRR